MVKPVKFENIVVSNCSTFISLFVIFKNKSKAYKFFRSLVKDTVNNSWPGKEIELTENTILCRGNKNTPPLGDKLGNITLGEVFAIDSVSFASLKKSLATAVVFVFVPVTKFSCSATCAAVVYNNVSAF